MERIQRRRLLRDEIGGDGADGLGGGLVGQQALGVGIAHDLDLGVFGVIARSRRERGRCQQHSRESQRQSCDIGQITGHRLASIPCGRTTDPPPILPTPV